MPIVMPTVVDDNGTGTTGTILDLAKWTALGSAIDAAIAAGIAPAAVSFTPIDGSGAALAFTGVTGTYVKLGKIVVVSVQVSYPATASGAQAKIAGLPFAASVNFGFTVGYQTGGVTPLLAWLTAGLTVVSLATPVSMAAITNANMSGATVVFSGAYLTT